MKLRRRAIIHTRNQNLRRGAALYVSVMAVALLVSVLGLAGLLVTSIERQRVGAGNDMLVARSNARSAVVLALRVLANDPNWRTTYTSGVETTPQAIGPASAGAVSWVLEDSDGNLTDSDTKLQLKGVGRVGNVVQVLCVDLTTTGNPLTCLEVAACSDSLIDFESNSVVTSNQTIHSNVSITSGGTVNADVESVGAISGGGYTGTTTTPVAARTVPSASVFDYYIANGTNIPISSIPKAGPNRSIKKVVLSPANNPYGATNPQGIYVIDCGGAKVRIEYARIIGTLVLINPDPVSDIQQDVSWEPAVANYPALLVQGSIEFRMTNDVLDENRENVNFNPPGSPYQGATDSDQTDTYPSQIKGLVYVSVDAICADRDTTIEGVLVTGRVLNVNGNDSLTVNYDSRYFTDPPPGFSQGSILKVIPGSWRRDVAP